MAYKRKTPEEKKKEIEELTSSMDEQINSYFESEENLKEHLAFMSNFYNYSSRNMALIEKQFQGAVAVGSFNFWKEKGASVKKGEKGIKILVPTPVEYFKRGEKLIQVKYATKQEKEQIKNRQLQTEKKLFFSIGHVFEYTQTNAREQGLDVSKIFGRYFNDGSIDNEKEMLAALNKIADKVGFEIMNEAPYELGAAKGVAFPYEKKIALNPRNTDYENVTTLIHELAHAKLHVPGRREELERSEREFQAEMVAYVVANRYEIDTTEFSLSYLAGWTQGTDLNDKERLLREVRETSKEFIDIIDNHFSEIGLLKDNELDISNKLEESQELPSVQYINETSCLMMKHQDELIDTRFYNPLTEVPKDKEEEEYFRARLEKDTKEMLQAHGFSEGSIEFPDEITNPYFDKIKAQQVKGNALMNNKDYYEELLVIQENNGLTANTVEFENVKFTSYLKENNPDDFKEYLNNKALYTHEQNNGEINFTEPMMYIHGMSTDFEKFGELNNREFENLHKVEYTIVLPDEEKGLVTISNFYENNKYIHPLHQLEKENIVDKETYNKLENNWHDVLLKNDEEYIQSVAPKIRSMLNNDRTIDKLEPTSNTKEKKTTHVVFKNSFEMER